MPPAGDGCPNLPPTFSKSAHDTGEISIGSFAAPAGGRQSWGEAQCEAGDAECCADGTRVGPPEEPCGGSYRHFPGQSFGSSGDWSWVCPYTGKYILLVTANVQDPQTPLPKPGQHSVFVSQLFDFEEQPY